MDNAQVFITGRLTRDVEVRSTQGGNTVASLGVAVNRGKKDSRKVSFFDVTMWDTNQETLAKLTKGVAVDLRGELTQESWEDKEGNKRSKVVITARSVSFLVGRQGAPAKEEAENDTVNVGSAPAPTARQGGKRGKTATAPAPTPADESTGEEIPF